MEKQAIDRAHRTGQTRQVMVYWMIAQNTIEEKVIALAQRKAALFAGVMDDGQLFSGRSARRTSAAAALRRSPRRTGGRR